MASAKVQCDPFQQHLVLGENRVAGVACFTVAWTTPDPLDARVREAPVLELASDEAAEGFFVHSGLPRGGVTSSAPRTVMVNEYTTGGVSMSGQY